jgi:hypothetical protein
MKSSTQFHIKDSESQAKNMAKNDYKKKKYKKDAKCKKKKHAKRGTRKLHQNLCKNMQT